jgi:acyl-coenzyme A synthetase/AMP-(fatty) acid ligase
MEHRENAYKCFHKILEEQAKRFSSKNFIENVDPVRCISFEEMNRRCNKVANFLKTNGLDSRDAVTVIGNNSIETLIIFFGVLKYGAIINPLNCEESSHNISQLIQRVGPKMVVAEAKISLDLDIRDVPFFSFSTTGHDDPRPDDFFVQIGKMPSEFKDTVGERSDIGEILFTSGTTEVPKGILWTREKMFFMVEELVERMRTSPEDKLLEYRAYSWASAQLLSVLSSIFAGCTLVLAKRFSRSHFVSWLKDYSVTKSAGVPAVLNILVSDPVNLHQNNVPHLQFITSSSAPLSMETFDKFESMYGIPINQMAGMSEAGWIMVNPPEKPKKGSVGLPLKYKRVSILGANGERCAPGEEGEIVISGTTLGEGYLTEKGFQPFPKEGIQTGDIGYVDEDGYVFITGRIKDLIIRGGVNISPLEIDNRLLQHPMVTESATVGMADPKYGEVVASFVVLSQGQHVTENELRDFCRETLPEFKIPQKILFVSEMPRTLTGKIVKRVLTEKLRQLDLVV